jgi:hypothetical protein
MSNIIRFLETMGSKPISPADYAATVAALEVGAPQRKALLDRDHAALNDLLGGRKKLLFAILAADEEQAPDA